MAVPIRQNRELKMQRKVFTDLEAQLPTKSLIRALSVCQSHLSDGALTVCGSPQ